MEDFLNRLQPIVLVGGEPTFKTSVILGVLNWASVFAFFFVAGFALSLGWSLA